MERISFFTPNFLVKIRLWLTIFSAASFFFLINSSTNLNALAPYLVSKFHFTSLEISFLFACYYYSNITFVFIAGIIVDKFSTKKILIISYMLACASILAFASTQSLIVMALSRLVLGVVGSFSMILCAQVIMRCFAGKKITFIIGIVTAYATFGVLLSQTPLIIAIEKFGWYTSIMINFWLGLLFCIITVIFVQDVPQNIQPYISKSQLTLQGSIKKTILSLQNCLLGFSGSLSGLPSLFFSLSLGVLYLQQTKGFTKIDGANIVTCFTIGNLIGSPLTGWLSDKIHNRKLILIASNFLMFLILLIVIYTTASSFWVFTILFFLFGLVANSQVVIYSLVAENNPVYLIGAANGFAAALMGLGGVYMLFLGKLIDMPALNLVDSYRITMLVLLGVLMMAMCLALFIKDPKAKN